MIERSPLTISVKTEVESDIDYRARLAATSPSDVELLSIITAVDAFGPKLDAIGLKHRCFRKHTHTTVTTKQQ